jgi:transposase
LCMWKESSVMSQRIQMMSEFVSGEVTISELAEHYEVSRKTVYKWIERFEQVGWEGLRDQSRAPDVHPNAVSAQIEEQVLELKAARPLWGAPKLRRKLRERDRGGEMSCGEHGE